MKSPLLIVVILLFALVSCQQGATTSNQPPQPAIDHDTIVPTRGSDSVLIVDLLKKVYRWHITNLSNLPDFPVLIKDSFQTGLDYAAFNKTYSALEQTGWFTPAFLGNYKNIADSVNRRLTSAHPPLFNEINFAYQDADLWTASQEDYPNLWDHFVITDFSWAGNSADLQWSYHEKGFSSVKYKVGFYKAAGKWRIDNMAGFDSRLALQP